MTAKECQEKYGKMSKEKFSQLPKEVLHQISMVREERTHLYSKLALKAQKILWVESGGGFNIEREFRNEYKVDIMKRRIKCYYK